MEVFDGSKVDCCSSVAVDVSVEGREFFTFSADKTPLEAMSFLLSFSPFLCVCLLPSVERHRALTIFTCSLTCNNRDKNNHDVDGSYDFTVDVTLNEIEKFS